jgi:hypothetical protein
MKAEKVVGRPVCILVSYKNSRKKYPQRYCKLGSKVLVFKQVDELK